MTRKKQEIEQPLSFEATIARVEAIVSRMESDEQPLEQAILDFEAGMGLTRQAQELLRSAEQKVQQLSETADGEPVYTPLNDDENQE